MTREEAKKAAEVMMAYAEGKTIQICYDGEKFCDVKNPVFDWKKCLYRIKPKVSYRPFKDAKECWEEMRKHKPFGWFTNDTGENFMIIHTGEDGYTLCNGLFQSYTDALKIGQRFIDGTPLGVIEK